MTVKIRDLGFRWGSARPTAGPPRINIHWATLQLPPSLIDYVLVHDSLTSANATTLPSSGPTSNESCPATRSAKPPSGPPGQNIWLGQTVAGSYS